MTYNPNRHYYTSPSVKFDTCKSCGEIQRHTKQDGKWTCCVCGYKQDTPSLSSQYTGKPYVRG